MKKEIRWRNSIAVKFLGLFFVAVLPIYLFGYQIYSAGYHMILDTMGKNAAELSEVATSKLEDEITKLYYLETSLTESAVPLTYFTPTSPLVSPYENLENMLDFQERMQLIGMSSSYVEDIRLHIPNINKTISKNTGIQTLDLTEYQKLEEHYADFSKQELKPFILWKNEKLYLISFNPSYIYGLSDTPDILCAMELSAEQIIEDLNVFSSDMDSYYCIYSDDQGIVVGNVTEEMSKTISSGQISSSEEEITVTSIPIAEESYLVTSSHISKLHMDFFNIVSEKYFLNDLGNYPAYLVWFSILIAIVSILLFVMFYHFFKKPLQQLVSACHQVEQENFDVSIVYPKADEFGYVFSSFNHMIAKIKNLFEQIYKQKLLVQKAELKQLQAQINPHFLYNSYFILHRRIKSEDYENALQFSEYLGEYFRYITKHRSDFVPLQEEYHHAVLYAKIQSVRFSNRVSLEIQPLPESYADQEVPWLIIQPIIENAFHYALEGKAQCGLLKISFRQIEGDLEIIIEDNGSIAQERIEELSQMLTHPTDEDDFSGLRNISARLVLKFGESYRLRFSKSSLGGLCVVIPIKSSENK